MKKIQIILLLLIPLFWTGNAFACNPRLDPLCDDKSDEGIRIEKGARDRGKAIEKGAADDTGDAFEKASDTGNARKKAARRVGTSGGQPASEGEALTPVRQYLRAKDIPPPDAGAYGIVVFQSKPTAANQKKLNMVCNSFVAFFPRSETSGVPLADQMITIWPLDKPDAKEAEADDCDFVLKHYDLNAAQAAIKDARKQSARFDGEGPYLVGWSPSNSRGLPDKLVLVVDMSADNSQDSIDHKFLFWKSKIVESPELWRAGWSIDGLRVAIKEFSDQYGSDMLNAIKLVRGGK
jgi:hypothetical protein